MILTNEEHFPPVNPSAFTTTITQPSLLHRQQGACTLVSTTNTLLHQNTWETVVVTEYTEKEKPGLNNRRISLNVSHVSIYPHQH